MARPLRPQIPGVHYHVIARGNDRQTVFLDDDDYATFLGYLASVASRRAWHVWAHCLMPNHYHLLIYLQTATLSRGMRDLNGIYAQHVNRRHAKVGHVFAGRFKSLLVQRPDYLFELARYIVLNPVRAGLCDRPEAWPWSSYRATARFGRPAMRLDEGRLLDCFGRPRAYAESAYRTFVAAGIGQPAPPAPGNPAVIADAAFLSGLESRLGPISREVPRAQRRFQTLEDYARGARTRDEAIVQASRSGTYAAMEIARYFGVSTALVRRIVRAAASASPGVG